MIYPITPCPAPRMTAADKWQKRPRVLRYRAFRDEVRAHRVVLGNGARVTFWMPMPASWSEAKRVRQDGQPHQQRPDIDNLLKALLDAIYEDDAGIWHIGGAQKRWARDGAIEIHGEG